MSCLHWNIPDSFGSVIQAAWHLTEQYEGEEGSSMKLQGKRSNSCSSDHAFLCAVFSSLRSPNDFQNWYESQLC